MGVLAQNKHVSLKDNFRFSLTRITSSQFPSRGKWFQVSLTLTGTFTIEPYIFGVFPSGIITMFLRGSLLLIKTNSRVLRQSNCFGIS